MPSILNRQTSPPPYRRLRAYAFDPILSRQIGSEDINQITINLPWESNVKLGPVDSYLEVVDYDPASQVFYPPVNLNDQHFLAQDGLPPSEGNPQFHQQMVFAVARTTIGHFEQALGRRSLWSPRPFKGDGHQEAEFVEHLRASIPTLYERPMPITAPIRKPYSLATLLLQSPTPEKTCQVRWCLPAFHTT